MVKIYEKPAITDKQDISDTFLYRRLVLGIAVDNLYKEVASALIPRWVYRLVEWLAKRE